MSTAATKGRMTQKCAQDVEGPQDVLIDFPSTVPFSWRFQSARKRTDTQSRPGGGCLKTILQDVSKELKMLWLCLSVVVPIFAYRALPGLLALGERWSSSPPDFLMSLDASLRVEEKRCWLFDSLGQTWMAGMGNMTAYMWHVYIVNVNICKYHIVVVYCVNVNILYIYICIQHVRLIICCCWSLILPSVCIFHLDQTRDIQKFSRIQWLDMIYWKPKGSFQHESLFGCVNCLFELFTQWMLDPSKHVYFATAMAMYRE